MQRVSYLVENPTATKQTLVFSQVSKQRHGRPLVATEEDRVIVAWVGNWSGWETRVDTSGDTRATTQVGVP